LVTFAFVGLHVGCYVCYALLRLPFTFIARLLRLLFPHVAVVTFVVTRCYWRYVYLPGCCCCVYRVLHVYVVTFTLPGCGYGCLIYVYTLPFVCCCSVYVVVVVVVVYVVRLRCVVARWLVTVTRYVGYTRYVVRCCVYGCCLRFVPTRLRTVAGLVVRLRYVYPGWLCVAHGCYTRTRCLVTVAFGCDVVAAVYTLLPGYPFTVTVGFVYVALVGYFTFDFTFYVYLRYVYVVGYYGWLRTLRWLVAFTHVCWLPRLVGCLILFRLRYLR